MSEQCQRCKQVGQDRRLLQISCLYDLKETGIPFGLTVAPEEWWTRYYTLRICKGCRAELLMMLRKWFDAERAENLDDQGIMSVSLDEYERLRRSND